MRFKMVHSNTKNLEFVNFKCVTYPKPTSLPLTISYFSKRKNENVDFEIAHKTQFRSGMHFSLKQKLHKRRAARCKCHAGFLFLFLFLFFSQFCYRRLLTSRDGSCVLLATQGC